VILSDVVEWYYELYGNIEVQVDQPVQWCLHKLTLFECLNHDN